MNYLSTTNLINPAIIILLIGYIFYKQVAVRPVKPTKYVIWPFIFTYITIGQLTNLHINIYMELPIIILLSSIGMISGVATGIVTKIFTGEDGILYQKGGLAAAILLLFTIPIRIMLRHSIATLPGGAILQSTGASYLIMISSQFIMRSITVLVRCPQVCTLYLNHRKNRKTRKRLRNAN